MYRYEVTLSVKNGIEGVIGRPVFYEDGGKYYIDGTNKDNSFQYYDSSVDNIVSKNLDEICDDLYSSDFSSNSSEYEYSLVEKFSLDESEKTDVQKALRVAVYAPEGSDATKVTHDWTDKTTWYGNAEEVNEEELSQVALTTKYISVNENWIDLTHGKLFEEHDLGNRMEPVVKVGGVEVTSGFTIDYQEGSITFDSMPGGTVEASYWKATDSEWMLSPESGKVLSIEHSEIQFSKDVIMTGWVQFEIWGYHPDQVSNPGLKIMYGRSRYNNVKDLINGANLGQGFIPAFGGLDQDVLVFPFNYNRIKPLKSSLGMDLRVRSENDIAFTGEWATATFYVLSEDEA